MKKLILTTAFVLMALTATATPRILIVGDSWSAGVWGPRALDDVLLEYGITDVQTQGDGTALAGSTAAQWASPEWLAALWAILTDHPTIDSVHLMIGGNDVLTRIKTTNVFVPPASWQRDGWWNNIKMDVQTIVTWCLAHPNIKHVVIAGYDYIDRAVIEAYYAGCTGQTYHFGGMTQQQVNTCWVEVGVKMKEIAAATPGCWYVHNFGLLQYHFNTPAGAPKPGGYPTYEPWPGGNLQYPMPTASFEEFICPQMPWLNFPDGLHPNTEAHKVMLRNAVEQFYLRWYGQSTLTVTISPAWAVNAGAQWSVDGGGSWNNSGESVSLPPGDYTVSFKPLTDAITPADQVVTIATNSPTNTTGVYADTGPLMVESVTPGIPEPSELTSVPFAVRFNKAVRGFSATEIALNVVTGSGTAQVANFAGGGANYTFDVTVLRGETISVCVAIPAGAVVDVSEIPNLAGGYTDGMDDAYTFAYPSGPGEPGDLYVSHGSLGDLMVSSGAAIVIDTGATPPWLRVNAQPDIHGVVTLVDGGNVAKFPFANVDVASGVAVTVSGNRPLVIAASGDMNWNTALDVSGVIGGRAGGGVGGAGGTGGVGGQGGDGGISGGTGAIGAAGGLGSPGPFVDYGNGMAWGEDGAGRKAGTEGGSGSAGNAGTIGSFGYTGSHGFGGQGIPGTEGAPGNSGAPASQTNGATGGTGGGGAGGGGEWRTSTDDGDDGGDAAGVGNDGGNAGIGSAGGDGGPGGVGGNAQFTAMANTLLLAGGHGGGGGGGGGGGAGGQGGGKGGGGSSGAGGGGGGLSYTTWFVNLCTSTDGYGGMGGGGGAGRAGGNGGVGGTAETGASGGSGGVGGGAVVLAARGLLRFGGMVDISANPPQSGGAERPAVPGNAGSDPGNIYNPGTSGLAGGQSQWSLPEWYCIPVIRHGGAGGAGSRGGRGGIGGTGGSSGVSGAGGDGGLGTPGMVKLHASVVLAGGGTIACENHTASTVESLRGRTTLISNMTDAPAPAFTDDYLLGATTNDEWLKSSAPYASGLQVPLLPDLEGALATGGFTVPGFWNESDVHPTGATLLELVRLEGTASPFLGLDQIFLVNNGGEDVEGVVLDVTGYPPYHIGMIPDGAIWTTTVPAGVTVSFMVAVEVAILEGSVTSYTGEPFTLTAETTGGQVPFSYRWMRNGETVQEGPDETYTVASATPGHAGSYSVRVTDALGGQATSPTSVPVAVAPPVTVTEDPQSTTVPNGGSHIFTVTAAGGHGALQYDWRKDTASLGAPSQPFLSINPVTGDSAGDYDVVISDALGAPPQGQTISASAMLDVSFALAVIGPQDVIAYADETEAAFEVSVTCGVPPYSYVWGHNGEDLEPSMQPGGPTLALDAPLASHAGTYSCMVTDSATPPDTEASATASLDVYPRISFTEQPESGEHYVGATVVLHVDVAGGVPSLNYVWRKDGTPLPLEEQPQSNVLTLANLQLAGAGDYDVFVYDSHEDSATSATAVITVLSPPHLEIITPPQGGTVKVGEAFLFAVETSGGAGTLSYTWWFDDGVSPPHTIGGNAPQLAIAKATRTDTGSYWVEVGDIYETVVSEPAQLFVRLTIIRQPEGGEVPLGSSLTLSVVSDGGAGPLHYQWKFEAVGKSAVNVGDDSPQFVIADARLEDIGAYWVEISDETDTVVSDSASVMVIERTQLPAAGLRTLVTITLILTAVGLRFGRRSAR